MGSRGGYFCDAFVLIVYLHRAQISSTHCQWGKLCLPPTLEIDSVWENIYAAGSVINQFRLHCYAQTIILKSLSWSCTPVLKGFYSGIVVISHECIDWCVDRIGLCVDVLVQK